MPKDFLVRCPCCGAQLDVDARTGQVLRHRRPGERPQDLFEKSIEKARRPDDPDDAFRAAQRRLDERRKEAEDRFGKESDQARRDLADGREVRPPNPFDNE